MDLSEESKKEINNEMDKFGFGKKGWVSFDGIYWKKAKNLTEDEKMGIVISGQEYWYFGEDDPNKRDNSVLDKNK